MTKPPSQIRLAHAYNYLRFRGAYYLVGFNTRIDVQKQPFWEIYLSDASDSLKVFCRDQSCIYGKISPQSIVDVEVKIELMGRFPHFRCKLVHSRDFSSNQLDSLIQLPSALCPIPFGTEYLVETIEQIKNRYLKEFATRVLLQPGIGLQFIRCPASLNHHHNYSGGLLVHSLEVASKYIHNTRLPSDERDLGIVAALLHDIGKTQTLTPDLTRTSIGYMVSHDELTLEICSGALRLLESKHAGFANHLRHVWTCASPGSRYGFKAKTDLARTLREFDASSANIIK